MPPKEKKKASKTGKKEEAKFGDIERTQCDQDNSIRNTSQYGTLSVYAAAPQQGKPAVNPNVYKGPSIAMLKERIKSEGIPIISANTEKFNEHELKTIEEFLIKRNGLRLGDTIESSARRYHILASLGEGRYCDVYLADEEKDGDEDERRGKFYAVKIDKRKHEFRTRQKIEVGVYDKIRSATKVDANFRFPEYIESGISRGKPFIITNVLGPNISKVREKAIKKGNNYDRKTAYFLALETLRVLRDFHKLGYVHRDIKPNNFCIGVTKGENYDKIYLIDFASAARTDDTNQLELLRMEKSYPLTNQNLVFCALEAHRAEIMTRKCDIVSWFFMVVDIFDRDILRWKKWDDVDKIVEAKIAFWKDRSTLLSPLPKVIQDISGMIEEAEPKYDKMLHMLNDEKKELDQKFPLKKYEWMHLNF